MKKEKGNLIDRDWYLIIDSVTHALGFYLQRQSFGIEWMNKAQELLLLQSKLSIYKCIKDKVEIRPFLYRKDNEFLAKANRNGIKRL
jgi:hypothetical protein